MDRSFAARVARPFGAPSPRRSKRPTRGGSTSTRRPAAHLPSLLTLPGVLARHARAALTALWRRRLGRIALIAALLALPVLGGAWLWVRSSPFVAVQKVQISGVSGPDAAQIDGALAAAARRMSTLDVRPAALLAATASYPIVREVRAVPRFPHGLRIEVVEQPPVAALSFAGARTAVAADGVVLGPALLSGSLPTLAGYAEPAVGQRVHGANMLAYLAVIGAAPTPLAKLITKVYMGSEGLTVAMHGGVLAYFGDASTPHAKWLSFAQVLADPSSKGASYVDVRLPARPAAGFPSGVAPPDETTSEADSAGETTGNSESTIAALAAALTQATGVSAGASASETAGTPSPPTESEASSSEAAAPPTETPSETSTATPGEVPTEASSPTG
jgi:cell division protein FtsQ